MKLDEYLPEEIAETLCDLAYNNPKQAIIDECEKTICTLLADAKNPHLEPHFRTFYQVLERIVDIQYGMGVYSEREDLEWN